MPKKFTINETVSNKSWDDIDKTLLRNTLTQGLEDSVEGVIDAIREIYVHIPVESGHSFRFIPDTYSEIIRTLLVNGRNWL